MVTIALEAAIVYAWHAPIAATLTFAALTVGALFDAFVIAVTKGEVDDAPMREILGRVIDRWWAVLVVSFFSYIIVSTGLAYLIAGGTVDRLLSIPLLLIAASLIFAETIAVAIEDERWWMLVPQAFAGSGRVAWSGAMMWRAVVLFVLQLVPAFGQGVLTGILTSAHVVQPDFWAAAPLYAIWAVPMNVLVTLVFFDAIGYEPKRSCGE